VAALCFLWTACDNWVIFVVMNTRSSFPILVVYFVLVYGCGGSETAVDTSDCVAGFIDIGPDLMKHLTGNENLFVIARSVEGDPVAVQRITGLEFPLDFCISPANVLEPSGELPNRVIVSAILTPSDDPFALGFTGTIEEALSLGTEGVRITIPYDPTKAVAMRSAPTDARLSPTHGAHGAGTIKGTITLAVSPAGGIQPSDTLYIILRDVEGRMVAVSAAYKQPSFPLDYTVSVENLMMGRISPEQRVVLTVRLDRDGNALSSSGDIEGESGRGAVQIGDENINIVLDTVIQ